MSTKIHRLELNNFKSYRGKVVIGPFSNFTCIVGPNGSGKSNIMDSLSFALGASGEALRSRYHTDFICRSASPLFASVSVFFVLPDHREFSVTRTINGEGHMTVLVNQRQVSEETFQETLRKLHIGPRVNSFLVFQHEVEAIAQTKALELTQLLEQISGSGELKEAYDAKRKALNRANEALTAASTNKRGALAEVHQLRLHKKEAEKFAEVHHRYEEERHNLAIAELFYIETNLSKQGQQLEALQEKLKSMEGSLVTEEDIKKLKNEYVVTHKTYLQCLKENRSVGANVREKRSTLERIKASLQFLQRKYERQRVELEGQKRNDLTRSTENKRLEDQLQRQQTMLSTFEAQCAKEDEAHAKNNVMSSEQREEYHRLKQEANTATSALRQEMESLRRECVSMREGRQQCAISLENEETRRRHMKQVVEQSVDRVAELRRIEDGLIHEGQTIERNLEEHKKTRAQALSKEQERERELARLEEQLHELRFMKEDNKQRTKVSDALSTLRSMYPGIMGRLVDLCEIPLARYRNAITAALGRNLEAVVVDTSETAIACVKYLKEQRIATMTFLPLDKVTGPAVNDSHRVLGGTCKPAMDIVRFDVSLEPAMRYSLGQTFVCDALDEAKRVAFLQPGRVRYKVVTIDGSILLKNGSIQGGLASMQSRAKKWDEKKYADLRAARDSLVAELSMHSDAAVAKEQCEMADQEARLDFLRRRIAAIATEIASTETRGRNVKEELQRHDSVIAEISGRLKAYETKLESCESNMFRVQKAIAQIGGETFGGFLKRVKLPEDWLEWEFAEAKQARARAEHRQQLQLAIHKLETSLEEERKTLGLKPISSLEKVVETTRKELEVCEKDLITYTEITKQTEEKQAKAQESVLSTKQALEGLEERIRQCTASSETESAKIAQVRRNSMILQAGCDALRHQRLAAYQRCQIDEIQLPVVTVSDKKRGRVADAGEVCTASSAECSEAFRVVSDSGPGSSQGKGHTGETITVVLDFSHMSPALRTATLNSDAFSSYRNCTETLLEQLEREMEVLAPNLKASTRFSSSENKLGSSTQLLEEAREKARKALNEFNQVKALRTQRFTVTFDMVASQVDRVYRELTMGTKTHQAVHGTAYLTLEDTEEPYLAGTKYHATPPLKRFMPMDLLSGGERTMAALALLFAIHQVSPTPFFVLDEVDAALDAVNVQKLAVYLRSHTDNCQFVVVSLKEQLFHTSDNLIGVFKNLEKDSSGVLTMDLLAYPQG